MNLSIECLKDKWGTKQIIIYEAGKYAHPIIILAEGYAEKLAKSILQDLKEKDDE